MVRVLSEKTATPAGRVRATTLSAYEDVLYERYNYFGPTPWIMPVGVYHRTRCRFGLQYCPRCLSEDKEPYYRRRWRLAFMVLCERHQALLLDRCPQCGVPVNFHRDELGNFHKLVAVSLTRCHGCGSDLCTAVAKDSHARVTPAEAEFISGLLQTMDTGFVRVGECVVTYSHLYFTVLRQLMKILAMRNKRIGKLREAISEAYGVESYVPPLSRTHPDVQELGVHARRQLLGLARCLLEDWPYRFTEFSIKYKIWSSLWLRHLEPCARDQARTAPFWFWSVVREHLYRARYCPSDEETAAATRYLKQNGGVLNKSKLARLLGVAVVR
jgi:hypothetical protein